MAKTKYLSPEPVAGGLYYDRDHDHERSTKYFILLRIEKVTNQKTDEVVRYSFKVLGVADEEKVKANWWFPVPMKWWTDRMIRVK